MKKIILYILIVIAVLLIPVRPTDVGELEPVQAVWLRTENETVILLTDTEDEGTGRTVTEALDDLKQRCKGIVYLDTAQFLLVSENAVDKLAKIEPYLKATVKVCLWEGTGSIADAARYMQAHKLGIRLGRWQPEVKLPNLPM